MKTKKNEIEQLRENFLQGMLESFKKDGFLTPVFFIKMTSKSILSQIPDEYLSSTEGKVRFSRFLREICQEPCVSAVVIIYEAYLACTLRGSQLDELLDSGNLRVADLKEKQDAIVMHFVTPDCQESYFYPVDIKNKTIGEKFDTSGGITEGIFANLFKKAA